MTFNRLAKAYRWLEYAFFGKALWRCRMFFVPALKQAGNILLLGDGDGRFTAEIAKAFPNACVYYVDSSDDMLRLARNRVTLLGSAFLSRLRFINADLRENWSTISLPKIDLVATHYFLDCFTNDEVHILASRIAAVSAPGARWLVSEFAIPERQPFRLLGWMLISGLYFGMQLFTGLPIRALPDYRAALCKAGFQLLESRESLFGVLRAELWVK